MGICRKKALVSKGSPAGLVVTPCNKLVERQTRAAWSSANTSCLRRERPADCELSYRLQVVRGGGWIRSTRPEAQTEGGSDRLLVQRIWQRWFLRRQNCVRLRHSADQTRCVLVCAGIFELVTRTMYYHRQKYIPPCNHLDIGSLRLPTLHRHQPIISLIPS